MQRHPDILNRKRAGLCIVDVQEKIAAVMHHRQRVIENTVKLIKACRIVDVPIFITEQYPRGLGPTESAVREALGDVTSATKVTFSCGGVDGFIDSLRANKVEQIIVVGIETHVCVLQTALDLKAQGLQVHVLRDCVSSRQEIDFETALQRMQSAGIIISTVETALFELLEQAGTPEFKEVIELIR